MTKRALAAVPLLLAVFLGASGSPHDHGQAPVANPGPPPPMPGTNPFTWKP